jgi:hypothetical protein
MEESATMKGWCLAPNSMLGLRLAFSTKRVGWLTHHVLVIIDKI